MNIPPKRLKKRCGVTLIELTVVIVVILLLISLLVIGGKFYFNNSSRSACIVNINGVHKAIRSVQNIQHIPTGSDISESDIVGSGKVLDVMPTCPQSGGGYTIADKIAPVGSVMVFCDDYDPNIGTVDSSQKHTPGSTVSW